MGNPWPSRGSMEHARRGYGNTYFVQGQLTTVANAWQTIATHDKGGICSNLNYSANYNETGALFAPAPPPLGGTYVRSSAAATSFAFGFAGPVQPVHTLDKHDAII